MRYIDADKIEISAERGISDNGLIFIPMRDVQLSIDATPTADVVEVVRCRDCIHFKMTCYMDSLPDDYCSYGERRE